MNVNLEGFKFSGKPNQEVQFVTNDFKNKEK
jgi:hypothetical protein